MQDREELIHLYFHLGLSQREIMLVLSQRHGIVVSLRHLHRILKANSLFRYKNYSEIEEVIRFLRLQLQGSGNQHGYRIMHQKCKDFGLNVRKEMVRHILSLLHPEGVNSRRTRRLHRRAYFAKGPNYIWHFDSYDKLKPYGICINGCIDGFARKMIWLKAYNTSSDPKVIGAYYIRAVEESGGCPTIIRGDRGTENSTVRDLQQYFRRNGEDTFGGNKSFIYGKSTSNQRIESWWGFLRRECTQFWMDIFHKLKEEGHFDGGYLDKNLVLYSFLTLIQVSSQ